MKMEEGRRAKSNFGIFGFDITTYYLVNDFVKNMNLKMKIIWKVKPSS